MFSSSEGFVVCHVEQRSADVTPRPNRKPQAARTSDHPVQSSSVFLKCFLSAVCHTDVRQTWGLWKTTRMIVDIQSVFQQSDAITKLLSFVFVKWLLVKTAFCTSAGGRDINDGNVNNINSEDEFCRGVLWRFVLEIMMLQTHQRARVH